MPMLSLLSTDTVTRVQQEAFQLLQTVGVRVMQPEARQLLLDHGAKPGTGDVVLLSEAVVRAALDTVPDCFYLHDLAGNRCVQYGGDAVHFDPGSSGLNVLDPDTLQHRPALTADLVRLLKVVEMLPEYAAQSTALICSDAPSEIADLYRLWLVMSHSSKPVVTGGFTREGTLVMIRMLQAAAGGARELAEKPRAVFDVCPTPPLMWSEFAGQNLIDLARAGVPAEMVSMPLAGSASPVTLIGSVVQHAAESLSGICIHQFANPGAPIVWGGAPAIFDMRRGTTPMGAMETAMIGAAFAQVGKSFGLPTHTYLCASDAKILDAQAGLESGMTALVGTQAGINMISGAGMLDFLAAQSVEKLVLDAEIIGMTQRMLRGVGLPTETLALEFYAGFEHRADFLKQKATRSLFKGEQRLPSEAMDRGSLRAWQDGGSLSAFERARRRADELEVAWQRPVMEDGLREELRGLVEAAIPQGVGFKLPE